MVLIEFSEQEPAPPPTTPAVTQQRPRHFKNSDLLLPPHYMSTFRKSLIPRIFDYINERPEPWLLADVDWAAVIGQKWRKIFPDVPVPTLHQDTPFGRLCISPSISTAMLMHFFDRCIKRLVNTGTHSRALPWMFLRCISWRTISRHQRSMHYL